MYKHAGVFLELITDSNGFRNDDEAAAEGVFSTDIHSPEIPNMEITRIGRNNFIVIRKDMYEQSRKSEKDKELIACGQFHIRPHQFF